MQLGPIIGPIVGGVLAAAVGKLTSMNISKIIFIEELDGIVLGTYKGLEDALRKEDYRDIAVKLAKSAKNSKYNLEFAITGLLFCKNEVEFTKVFVEGMTNSIRQLLVRFRHLKCRNLISKR